MENQDILSQAHLIGEHAPVDAIPDPTKDGFRQWKEDMRRYFIPTLDRFIARNHAEALREKVLTAMKDGFVKLVLSQPYVKVPLQPMEPLPREEELHVIEEVFADLRFSMVH